MITIKQITHDTARDLNLKNESFFMPGKFVPELRDGIWSYRTEMFSAPETMVFPNENYDLEEVNQKGIAFGAYEDDKCIGVAVFEDCWLKYMYLSDLKVNAEARGKGVGKLLVRAGMEEAKKRGCRGVYTVAQDNNLNACMFYLHAGFSIGGFDNRVYTGTSQEGKADVIFYLDAE